MTEEQAQKQIVASDIGSLPMLDDYFHNQLDFKTLKYPKVIDSAIRVLPSSVPDKMKLFMAVQECNLLVSSLNNPIRLNSKTLVSTNSFNIMFSTSGSNKDSSIATIRSCFKESYTVIEDRMKTSAIANAKIECLAENGNDKDWKDFYKGNIKTLFPSISTTEGMMSQMDTLQGIGIGSFFMSTSELSSELKSSPTLTDNLKTLAIGYDLGNIPSKIVKTAELQSSDIKNLNMNVLLFSSMDTLMKDHSTRNKFLDLFTIQYARRALFFMNTEPEVVPTFASVLDLMNQTNDEYTDFEVYSQKLTNQGKLILSKLPVSKEIKLETRNTKLTSLDTALPRDILAVYKEYCSLRSVAIDKRFTIKKLAVKHLYWKALKMSGLFAMLQGKYTIGKQHLLMAISVVEHFVDDLETFQIEVEKEEYELIVDYFKYIHQNEKIIILTKHKLIKEGLISAKVSDKRFDEIIKLCNDSDKDSVYTRKKDSIVFKPLRKSKTNANSSTKLASISQKLETPKPLVTNTTETPVTVIPPKIVESTDSDLVSYSYKAFKIDGKPMVWADVKQGKEYRIRNGASGWVNSKKPFSNYAKLVNMNYAYSPYHFRDGYKDLEHIIDPSDTIVLDVDDTHIDMNSMSSILSEYKHIIATTSDNKNLYKYRIIFQLDRAVDLTAPQWKKFYRSIATLLHIEVDTQINKASMFQGYKDSVVITNYDGDLLPTKSHLINAYDTSNDKIKVRKKATTEKQLDLYWDDRYDIFEYAYDCESNRSITMYGAMREACDLGMPRHMVEELLLEINSEMPRPLDHKRLRKTIIDQIVKFV